MHLRFGSPKHDSLYNETRRRLKGTELYLNPGSGDVTGIPANGYAANSGMMFADEPVRTILARNWLKSYLNGGMPAGAKGLIVTGILRRGSRGDDVKQLQAQLNTQLDPSPRLTVDGAFGAITQAAVLRFQCDNWLVEDGEVGPCTWNALMGTETYTPILYNVPFIPQPTRTTCWAASTAMLTRSNVPAVIARTPSDLVLADGSLKNFSESDDPVTGSTRFARANFLTLLASAASWMPRGLVAMLNRGPLMFDMLWNAADYAEGFASPGHMIAVVGIRGDDDQSGEGTTLRIYDPWPPNRGKKYSVGYEKWINEVPTRTYHIYQKT